MLGLSPAPAYWYWMGVTRQPNPDRLSSAAAAGLPFYTVTGDELPMFAPSNGPHEGPMYAPYAHCKLPCSCAGQNRSNLWPTGGRTDDVRRPPACRVARYVWERQDVRLR